VRPRRAVVRDDVALPAAPALLHDAREQKGVRAAAALALRAPVVARLQRHEVADVQRLRESTDSLAAATTTGYHWRYCSHVGS